MLLNYFNIILRKVLNSSVTDTYERTICTLLAKRHNSKIKNKIHLVNHAVNDYLKYYPLLLALEVIDRTSSTIHM